MNALHLPKFPSTPKTVVLVFLAVALVLAVLATGAYQHHQEAVKVHEEAIQAAANQKAEKTAEQKAFGVVQGDLNIANNKAEIACSVLRQYSVNPKMAKLVTVPPVCSL